MNLSILFSNFVLIYVFFVLQAGQQVFCEHFENLFDRQLQYYEDTSSLIVQLSIQEAFAEVDEEVIEACQKRKKHQVTVVYCLNFEKTSQLNQAHF